MMKHRVSHLKHRAFAALLVAGFLAACGAQSIVPGQRSIESDAANAHADFAMAGPIANGSSGCALQGGLSAPLHGALSIQTGFGTLRLQQVNPYELYAHHGVDFTASLGSPVYAAQSGKIIAAAAQTDKNRKLIGYGFYVVISGGGKKTGYAHLTGKFDSKGAPEVLLSPYKVGTDIRAGAKFAISGNSGNAMGEKPHLHLEYGTEVLRASARGLLNPCSPNSFASGYIIAAPADNPPVNAAVNSITIDGKSSSPTIDKLVIDDHDLTANVSASGSYCYLEACGNIVFGHNDSVTPSSNTNARVEGPFFGSQVIKEQIIGFIDASSKS